MEINDFVSLVKPLIGNGLTNIAYYQFSSPPALPFGAYFEMDAEVFEADNKTYSTDQPIRFEVYTKTKDLKLEAQIQELFKDEVWERVATEWINAENCFLTVYFIY